MALNLDKNLKRYYSIREVAEMFELNESTLRYWEQEFPYLRPKNSGPAKIRQYQEKDIEQIRLIHNLVKVREKTDGLHCVVHLSFLSLPDCYFIISRTAASNCGSRPLI